MIVCDAQVHAPDVPDRGAVGGIERAALIEEMHRAGGDRCILVPLAGRGGDESANNAASLAIAREDPLRFRVMGAFDLTRPSNRELLAEWKQIPSMAGVRLAFVREPNRSLIDDDNLEWFWSAAEASDVPVMVFAPGLTRQITAIAARHPDLRLAVDHFGLAPGVKYSAEELRRSAGELIQLARFENVAVKASALPCAIDEAFPFPALHTPIEIVVEAFGAQRVFWGSDLTRLPCSYRDCVDLFRHALEFLTYDEKEWILGRGVMDWIGWQADC